MLIREVDPSNYQGIPLLCVVDKISAVNIRDRLLVWAETTNPTIEITMSKNL